MDKYDPNTPSDYDGIINKAADTHGVSQSLLRKLIWNESRFNPKAQSPTGPRGLGQFTKNTGAAYGLLTDEDFFNPEKSVEASARHLSELVGKYGGDELKAALAYNQGEGPVGGKQLQAYDSGDFSQVSEEGRKYMRNLLDVAKSPKANDLETFGGITPKGKGIPAEDAFAGIGAKSKVGNELPESHGFNVEGVAQTAPNEPFSKEFLEKTGMTQDDWEQRSTFFGFGSAAEAQASNSVVGMAYRAGRIDNSMDVFKDVITPTAWNSTTWSPDELAKIRREVKDPRYINVVTGGSPENLDALIKMANENFESDSKASDAGLGAQLSAGVVGAALDPLSYVPIAGQASKGFNLVKRSLNVGAQSAAWNAVSEGVRTSVAGGDADYKSAILGGFVFGAGMTALHDAIRPGVKQSTNEFAPIVSRMEAREHAINTGESDLGRIPLGDHLSFKESPTVPYADHPTLPGSAILADGSVLGPANPLNPKTLEEYAAIAPEKSRGGVSLGGFSELGQVLTRSNVPEVRGIASDLVRPLVGSKDGSVGKFGATASDIHERLHFADNRVYNTMFDAMRTALKDPEWSTGAFKSSKEGARQEIFKRAALAIERPELAVNLTDAEKNVMNIMKQHFDGKREMMENPAMFGNNSATSIFPNSRHVGTYVPNVYSREAKLLHIENLGEEGLQEAIAKSWMASYHARPEVKARVDAAILEEFPGLDAKGLVEKAEKMAKDKAYGISHTDNFQSSSVIDEKLDGMVGIENNNFLEARNLFDSDVHTTLPNGNTFSVNDLRDFDMGSIMPAYDRRINGDIAIMGGTGKTTKELKDLILQLSTKAGKIGELKAEAKALQDVVKILTGRARRDPATVMETAIRSLSDLGFFAKNAYMGIQNYTEIAGMLAKGNVRAIANGVPKVGEWMNRNKALSAKEQREISSVMFGKEFDDTIRPTRQDIIQRIRESSDASQPVATIVGSVKYATGELAARSPWTKVLNGTSNHILDVARQGFLSDMGEAAFKGKRVKWATDNYLNSASVTREQFDAGMQAFRDHAAMDPSGRPIIKDKKELANDPRVMSIWRLADRMADDTIMRPHKVSSQDTKAFGAGIKLAMQFKNFTLRALNARMVRDYYSATKDGRAIDTALTWVLQAGLAGTYYVGAAHLKSTGLQESERKDYLQKALDPSMVAYAMATRAPSSPGGAFNLIAAPLGLDAAKMVRSSINPKGDQKKEPRDKAAKGYSVTQEIMGSIGSQVPGAQWAGSVGATAINAIGAATTNSRATAQDYQTGLMNSLKEILPNDPLTQQLILHTFNEMGVNERDPRK